MTFEDWNNGRKWSYSDTAERLEDSWNQLLEYGAEPHILGMIFDDIVNTMERELE